VTACHHVVTLFWDALLPISHGHIFPRPMPDYYPVWISNFTAEPEWDLTASSGVNRPISVHLRLIVICVAKVSSIAVVGKTAHRRRLA
jgi:hypothetical protein